MQAVTSAEASLINLQIGFDARFPNQNQTKHCWQNYVDYYKCVNAKGEDFKPCRQVCYENKHIPKPHHWSTDERDSSTWRTNHYVRRLGASGGMIRGRLARFRRSWMGSTIVLRGRDIDMKDGTRDICESGRAFATQFLPSGSDAQRYTTSNLLCRFLLFVSRQFLNPSLGSSIATSYTAYPKTQQPAPQQQTYPVAHQRHHKAPPHPPSSA